MSGALAIVLAVVAVVAGFLILRSISDGGDDSLDLGGGDTGVDGATGAGTGTATEPGDSVVPAPTSTTVPPLVTTGASVIVVNANGKGGSAGKMSTALNTGAGFQTVDPTDASAGIGTLDASRIYFVATNPAAEQVANSVSKVLGGDVSVAPLEGTPPTKDGTTGGADVLLMLGVDKADMTADQLTLVAAASAATPNPPVAGGGTATGDAATGG